jgi:hypothetical protein
MAFLPTVLVVVALGLAAAPDKANAHAELHSGCTSNLLGRYYVGRGHVSCGFAKYWASRQIRGYRGPSGWRCRRYSGRNFGTCTSRRARVPLGHLRLTS